MKNTFIRTLAILALTLSTASAIEISDFIGYWRGKRTETQNGVGMYAKSTFNGTRRSDGGLLIIEKSDSTTWGLVTVRHEFHKGGKYRIQGTTSYGFIILSGSGTWKKSNGEILCSGIRSNVNETGKFSGRLKLTDRNHFRYFGLSGDTKVVLTGTRV
jgi:hypothetical protein